LLHQTTADTADGRKSTVRVVPDRGHRIVIVPAWNAGVNRSARKRQTSVRREAEMISPFGVGAHFFAAVGGSSMAGFLKLVQAEINFWCIGN
jgi:hypothetical protein